MQAAISHRVGHLFVRSQVRRLASVTLPSRFSVPQTTQRYGRASVLTGSLAFMTSTATIAVVSCEEAAPTDEELQAEWDDFYSKSIRPGEDDDEDDDDEEDEEDEDGEEEEGEEPEQEKKVEEPEQEEEGEEPEQEPETKVEENSEETPEEEKVELSGGESKESEEESESAASVIADESASDDDDKYENLPDEDEPTSCSICRINRQGPCRALWRKFEGCMKDKIHDEHGVESAAPSMAERCDKFMMPWISCFQEHRNFYTLVTNSMYQFEYLDDAEASVPEEQKRPMEDPDIDWTGYLKFIEESDLSLGDFVVAKRSVEIGPSSMKRKKMAESMKAMGVDFKEETLTFGDVNDPKGLCDCQAQVPLKDPETQHPIEVAYARDQAGNILGFDMFTSAKKEGKEESAAMNFTVRFGTTQDVTIYAIYHPEAQKGDAAIDMSAKRLYSSQPISVFGPTRQAGLLKPIKPISLPKGLVGEKKE